MLLNLRFINFFHVCTIYACALPILFFTFAICACTFTVLFFACAICACALTIKNFDCAICAWALNFFLRAHLCIRHVVCTTGTEICKAYAAYLWKKVGRRGLPESTPDGDPGCSTFRWLLTRRLIGHIQSPAVTNAYLNFNFSSFIFFKISVLCRSN